MGWTKKILRVDLSTGSIKTEPLNMEWAKEYLGQRGLATKYFVEEVDPKVEPLSPANKLIMSHRPADGHRGLHWRALLGCHQGRPDQRHRLLELGRLLGRRAQDSPAGT
jgi:hypothetical protein